MNHSTLSFTDLADSVAASGLVVEERLRAVLSSAGGDLDSLAKQLVAQGLLTQFQLSALRDGRGNTLRIGNYDLLDRLGAGGMGTVFKARHRRMKREVALKVLAASLSDNQVFVKRFQREVETIACLGHPNVVMAYDADEAEVGHFLVMEFVPGNDLARCVQDEGPFPLARSVNCILQAARGLAYAHSQGIIHRDVKPHNLLLDPTGVVKVTDLGLARLNHGADGPAEGTDVTSAGGVIGTADYMSPEQAIDSTTIDHRADIYSLGCTLYFLLSGRPPFSGPTFISILLKHRDAEIPLLSALRPETPLSLEELFRCMLAKKTEHRPQSMADVVRQLEEIATGLPLDQAESLHCRSSTTDLNCAAGALADSTFEASGIADQTLELESTVSAAGVLVVEPSRVQASIIGSYLAEISMPLAGTAPNGAAAIESIRRLRPRAVVSAMHLPDVDGLELAQQIRLEFDARAPGFVLITSEDSTAEASARQKLHRVVLLHKPFTPAQLQQAIRQVAGESTDFDVSSLDLERSQQKGLDRRALRVLIVDDSATARVQVRSVLQGLGFANFLEVPDGADAIAVAARENCDLVVTDYNMPLMDGRALVSYFKQNQATARIPILMVTSETNPRLLDAVRQLGVVAIIEKAFPANVVGPLLESLF